MNSNYTELSSALLKDFKSFIIQKMEVERFSKFINNFRIEFTKADFVACTDNKNVYLSMESEFKDNFFEFCKRNKIKKMEISFYMGLLIHEIGHILYTDFNFKGLKEDEAQFLNILEDGYIEKRLINTSSGVLIDSLILLRMYHRNKLEESLLEGVKTIDKQDSIKAYSFICSEILLFAKFNRTVKGGLLKEFLKKYGDDYKNCFKETNRKEAQLKLYKDVLEYLGIKSPSQEAVKQLGQILDNLANAEEINGEENSSMKANIKIKERKSSEEIEKSVEETVSKILSSNKEESNLNENSDKNSKNSNKKSEDLDGESKKGAGGDSNKNNNNDIKSDSELHLNERKKDVNNNQKVIVINDKTTKIEGKQDVQSLSKIINNGINKQHPKLEEIVYSAIKIMRDSILVSEAGKNEVKIAKNKYKSQYKKLANSLKKIVPEDEPFYVKSEYSGKIDTISVGNKLHSNNYNFFKKKHLPAERRNVSVALLLDESGSMIGDRIKASRDALLILNEAFKAIDLEPLIFGHTTDNAGGKVEVHTYSSLEGLYSLPTNEMRGNVDYEALKYVYSEMDKINSDIKLVFVISDGLPCGKELEYADLIRRDEEHNIKVFGCGIGDCANQVRNFYKKNIIIDNIEDFPKAATKILKKYL